MELRKGFARKSRFMRKNYTDLEEVISFVEEEIVDCNWCAIQRDFVVSQEKFKIWKKITMENAL